MGHYPFELTLIVVLFGAVVTGVWGTGLFGSKSTGAALGIRFFAIFAGAHWWLLATE